MDPKETGPIVAPVTGAVECLKNGHTVEQAKGGRGEPREQRERTSAYMNMSENGGVGLQMDRTFSFMCTRS